ncbi:MAG: FAD-binding oxidoreductase [Alphaproteobacteria bacterium]|nr:FAD-binding oxidoreductase [Alphaproteobacteria bacterium]
MSDTRRIVVVGAGTLGLATALSLAERGVAVTVIEADHAASGSSGRSIGVVGTQHVDRFEIQMRALSVRRMLGWKQHGLDFRHIGYMRLGRTAGDLDLFEKSVAMQAEFGLRHARVLTPQEIRKLVPHISTDGIAGALFGPNDGYLDPHLYCGLLVEMIRARGGIVKQRCRLVAAGRTKTGYRLRSTAGDIDADGVVLAPGAWASQVAKLFGHELPVIAERHEAVTIKLPAPLPYVMPMVMDYVPGSGGTGLNFRHERADELIAETHRSYDTEGSDPDDYDQQLADKTKEELAELLLERLPGLPGAGFGRGWAGLYPKSPDGRPLVGPLSADEPMLVAAAGAGGYGIQLSPIIGTLAADWITAGEPVSLPEAVRLKPSRERAATSA